SFACYTRLTTAVHSSQLRIPTERFPYCFITPLVCFEFLSADCRFELYKLGGSFTLAGGVSFNIRLTDHVICVIRSADRKTRKVFHAVD
ncbi:hypothetical protein BaRGS_00003300, partial [Batillaria attramentaria]